LNRCNYSNDDLSGVARTCTENYGLYAHMHINYSLPTVYYVLDFLVISVICWLVDPALA